MAVQVMNKFGKVVQTAKSWRHMGAVAASQAARAARQDEWLTDARTGASLMSGGSLASLYRPTEDRDRARQPEKSWKQYPHRNGRTTRQWRVV